MLDRLDNDLSVAPGLPESTANQSAVHTITIDSETGAGFEAVAATVRSIGERATEIVGEYGRSEASLRLFAFAGGVDVIDCYDRLGVDPSGRFHAARGNEQPGAERIIAENRRRGCLVDALTLEIVRRHGLLDLVTMVLGPLCASQATFDQFIARGRRDRPSGPLQHAGKLAHLDGRPVLIEEPVVLREVQEEDRRAALAWVRANTRLVPSVGTPALAGRLHEALPLEVLDVFIDDMLAAAQADVPILSDDFGYRKLSIWMGQEAVGLLAILRHAREHGLIEHHAYVTTLAELAAARHSAIPLGTADFIEALRLDGGEIGATLRPLASQLGGTGADMTSHLAVAIAVLDQIWSRAEHCGVRLQLILLFADRLLDGAPAARARFGEAAMRDPDSAVGLLEHHVKVLMRDRAASATHAA